MTIKNKKLIVTIIYITLLIVLITYLPVNAEDKKEELNLNDLKKFSDLRGTILTWADKSLVDIDLRNKYDVLITATFDTLTIWPSKDKLPENFNPDEFIIMGQNPGLNVRHLHEEGITGKNVKVAIIDQPLLLAHQEYKGKIEKYTCIDCEGVEPQMHGAAVASLLAGDKCGVAPGVSLYYWAVPSWKRDYSQYSEALEQIMDYNKDKAITDKIRVVSVSIGFQVKFKNLDLWKKILEKAKENGLIVIDCEGDIFGIGCPIYENINDPKNYDICYFAQEFKDKITKGTIYIPIDNRSTASCEGEEDYVFWARGGLSWGTPYLTGIIALGYQINSNLDEDTMYKYLTETGTSFNRGWIVNPEKFIKKIKSNSIKS